MASKAGVSVAVSRTRSIAMAAMIGRDAGANTTARETKIITSATAVASHTTKASTTRPNTAAIESERRTTACQQAANSIVEARYRRATPSAIALRQNAHARYQRNAITIESASALGESNAGGIRCAPISGCSKSRIAA